jgi:GTP cyclohydrolase I
MNDYENVLREGLKVIDHDFKLGLTEDDILNTPKRINRFMKEFFGKYLELEKVIADIKDHGVFASKNDEMIITRNIRSYSLCPHHFLPVELVTFIGYIPSEKVIGLSKMSRIVEALSSRPVLQEDLVEDIMKVIEDILKPKGAIVVSYGRHFCMVMRGIKKEEATIVTSSVRGSFEQPVTRAEFMSLIKTKELNLLD